MMDATRLHNAALTNGFLARMLREDHILGRASGKYVKALRHRNKVRQAHEEEEKAEQQHEDQQHDQRGARASQARSSPSTTAAPLPSFEEEEDLDFGQGELDMQAFNNIGVPHAVAQALSLPSSLSGSPRTSVVVPLAGGTEEEEEEEDWGMEDDEEEEWGEELGGQEDVFGTTGLGGRPTHRITSSHGGHIPFVAAAAAATTMAATPLTLPAALAAPATASVFNKDKMCWEAPEDDDLMAGFSDDEEEDEDGGEELGSSVPRGGAEEEDDFMAGFTGSDSEEEDWG
jgi:hypothetical protein